VIEQITYLLVLRRLDGLQTLAEVKGRAIGGPVTNPPFLPGHEHLRWSELTNTDADVMYRMVGREAAADAAHRGAEHVGPGRHVRAAGRCPGGGRGRPGLG
jgi:type I restriction enzyme M protein